MSLMPGSDCSHNALSLGQWLWQAQVRIAITGLLVVLLVPHWNSTKTVLVLWGVQQRPSVHEPQ